MNEKQDDLIRRAKKNDDDAFSELFKQYTPIVLNLCRNYYVRSFEREDWIQEARIVLYLAVSDYNELYGVHFSVYYKLLLKRHLFSLIRRDNAKKRGATKKMVSLNTLHDDAKIKRLMSDMIEFETINHVIIIQTIENMIDQLNTFDRRVFCAYLEGKTLKEISQEYECTVYKASQILKKIKTRMITLLKDC